MSTDLLKINSVLKGTVQNIIQRIDLQKTITQQLQLALAHLTEIDLVYNQTEEQLYQATLSKVQSIPLLQFQLELLLEELIVKYFKRLALFKQAYEVSVLHSKKDKYSHLEITEPWIAASIPLPYRCPPLSQAKFISDSSCISFEEEEQG